MVETLTIELERPLLERLQGEAERAGRALSDYVADLVSDAVEAPAHEWALADARLAEYDRTGEGRDAREVMTELVAEVRRRAASRV